CAGANSSSSRTRWPALRRCQAVQAPNTPAPMTILSKPGLLMRESFARAICDAAKPAASVDLMAVRRVMRLLMDAHGKGGDGPHRGLSPLWMAAGGAFLRGGLHGAVARAEDFLGRVAVTTAFAVQSLDERHHVAQLCARQVLPVNLR